MEKLEGRIQPGESGFGITVCHINSQKCLMILRYEADNPITEDLAGLSAAIGSTQGSSLHEPLSTSQRH